MNAKPYKVEKFATPEGHDHWLVGADGRAIARLIPNHPAAEEIAALLSSTPLLRAALQNLVKSHARLSQNRDELLPEDEQPAEIREALAALRAASPVGTPPLEHRSPRQPSAGSEVPRGLRDLADQIGRVLAGETSWEEDRIPEYVFTALHDAGGKVLRVDKGAGEFDTLAEFKVQEKTWLVWVSGNACGVEPCKSVAIAVMSDTYGESGANEPDRYQVRPTRERS